MDTQSPQKGAVRSVPFVRSSSHAGAAPLAAGLLALCLIVLTTLVATGRTIGLDRWVNEAIPKEGEGPAPLHALAVAITRVANPPLTVAVLLSVVALWAIWARSPWPVLVAAPAVLALVSAVLAGKWLLGRPGPPSDDPAHLLGAYPSGHTATALVCSGVFAILVSHRHPQHGGALLLAATAWTTLVAFSLVWLHFHWLSDVLGALLLGALLLVLLYRWPWHLVAPAREPSTSKEQHPRSR